MVIDTEGKMFACNQIESGRSLGFVIDWASRKDSQDEDYVDFALPALRAMTNEFREALGMDTQANPISDNSRW